MTVLYEFHLNYKDIFCYFIPLLLSGGALLFAFMFRKERKEHRSYKVLSVIMLVLSVVFAVLFTIQAATVISEQISLRRIIKNGTYETVTGYVENYHAMPYDGHDMESFTINGVEFEFSDYELRSGYHRAASHGGVIKENGQYLEIRYVHTDDYTYILYIAEKTE